MTACVPSSVQPKPYYFPESCELVLFDSNQKQKEVKAFFFNPFFGGGWFGVISSLLFVRLRK